MCGATEGVGAPPACHASTTQISRDRRRPIPVRSAIMVSGMTVGPIDVAQDLLTEFCRRNGIRKLAVYGSVLTDRFSEASDVDVLVEFDRNERVGYLRM